MIKIPAYSLTIIFSFLIFILLLILTPTDAFALNTYVNRYTNDSSSYTSKPTCPDAEGRCGDTPPECWNSESVGVTSCGQKCDGGNPWSKYRYSDICYLESSETDPDTLVVTNHCARVYEYSSAVYSTADKCDANSSGTPPTPPFPYLQKGYCDGSIGDIYKTCCTNTTPSYVISDPKSGMGGVNSCVQIDPISGAPSPPKDGVCPDKTIARFCGFGGYPPCGQEACGPTGPVCGDNICEDPPENYNTCPQDCAGTPKLSSFSSAGCSSNNSFQANLSWSGNPLPSSDAGCPGGFWVDVDDNSGFSSYSNKCVKGTSTTAPDGFGGPGGAFSFQAGKTYYARVFNGNHSNIVSLTVPDPACTTAPGSCGQYVGGRLDTPNSSTCSSSILFTGQYWEQGGCFGFKANPSLSYIRFDGQNINFTATELENGSINKTINANPGTHNFTVHIEGYCPNLATNGVIELPLNGASCGSGSCSVPQPAPGFDYSLSCSNATVTQGQNTTSSINVTKTSGDAQVVNLSMSGLPSGASVSLNPTSCSPNTSCSSTATITTQTSTPAGSNTLTTTGQYTNSTTGVTTTRTASCTLTVSAQNTSCGIDFITPNPIPYDSSNSTFKSAQIEWHTVGLGGSRVWYQNGSTCTLSTCNSDGWTEIQGAQASFDASKIDYVWNPNSFYPAQGSTHTIAVSTPKGVICDVRDVSFGAAAASSAPAAAPPGCSVGASPSSVTPGGTVDVSINGPDGDYKLTCPDGTTRGPAARTSAWVCSTPKDIGRYSVDASGPSVSCSTKVTVQVTEADCRPQNSYNILAYGFNDPNFDPDIWPGHSWSKDNTNVCWYGYINESFVPRQSSLASLPSNQSKGQVLAATSCWKDSDCDDNNICTIDSCNDARLLEFRAGSCVNTLGNAKAVCGTSPNGGNMYCGDGSKNYPLGVCSDNLCDSKKNTTNDSTNPGLNPECSDGNACTQDTCTPPIKSCGEDSCYYAGIGTCSYKNENVGTVCGSLANKGNLYCGGTSKTIGTTGDGVCRDGTVTASSPKLCKSFTDCYDGNSCTADICSGYRAAGSDGEVSWPEALGTCKDPNPNAPPGTICEKDSSGNPTKVCSAGSDSSFTPKTDPSYKVSTCSEDYAKCTNPTSTPDTSNNACCGTTNIQGIQCQGSCYITPFPYYDIEAARYAASTGVSAIDQTEAPAKAGIVVHADGNLCGLSYTSTTDASGYAYFSKIPRTVGRSSTQIYGRVEYNVWAEIPNDGKTKFTRGTCYRIDRFGPILDTTNLVTLSNNNPACSRTLTGGGFTSGFAGFGFIKILPPWIQTGGGDVHSNTNINAPGGP